MEVHNNGQIRLYLDDGSYGSYLHFHMSWFTA